MKTMAITKTRFRVADFLNWQREKSLELNPVFQRRPVWKPDAKSFFIDTVLRGLPSPIIYIRERIELDTQSSIREIVDGQQRLRTLFSYIDETVLEDFKPIRDRFVVKQIHNPEVAGKKFPELDDESKKQILGYEISTHILPINIEDRDVLLIFARLNSTGLKLNPQELRNAEFFGEFKTIMYDLAIEQLERWRRWQILTDDQISRMKEVELSSDLVMNMIDGITGKTQKRLDGIYKMYDNKFTGMKEVIRRFRRVMDVIDDQIGVRIVDTVYTSEVYFFTLFVYLYNELYGLGSSLQKKRSKSISSSLKNSLFKASDDFQSEDVPSEVLDAVRRASADFGRRKTRLDYLISVCNA